MGDGRRGTAHQPTHSSQPRSFKHTQKNTRLNAHIHSQTQTRTHREWESTSTNNTERKRANEKGFCLFFLNITSSFLCSPCVFMSCHLVKRLYGLPRPHGNECGEVDCGSFRTPPGPALRASDKRVSPESFSLQTGKLFNLTSSPIPIFFLLFFSPFYKYRLTEKSDSALLCNWGI